MNKKKKEGAAASMDNIYKLNGKVPVAKAIPFGLQHILAMFVANIAPILIVAGVCNISEQEKATLIQFFTDPKSSAPVPPPKEEAPTDSSEKPMAVTTEADTIGVMIFVQYFARSPRHPSMIPPMSTAPIMAP